MPDSESSPTPAAGTETGTIDRERQRAEVRARNARRRRRQLAIGGTSAAAIAVVTAFVTALAGGIGGGAAQKSFEAGGTPAPTSATNAAAAPEHGFTIGISFTYPPGQSFALPEPLTESSRAAPLLLGFPDFTRGMTAFLRDQGGAARSTLIATMTFTGTGERPTRIAALRVAAVKRSAPFAGTAIHNYSGSDHPPINVTADLDGSTPDVTQSGRPYFGEHQTDITMSDREPFRVTFTGEHNAYEWVMAVDAIGPDGKVVTSYFGLTGELADRPEKVARRDAFRLTGPASAYRITYSDEGSDRKFHVVG